jgi:dipeptidase E
MKLYLSSFCLGNDPEQLVKLLSGKKKAAVIANAVDDVPAWDRKRRVEWECSELRSLGLAAEELDLRDYFGKRAALESQLDQYELLWARGGNAFILRRAMYESGFDQAMKARVADQNLVYGGYSAAICLLAPTLRGLELADDPFVVPVGYKSDVIWEGLGLIDYAIAPHYRSAIPEALAVEKLVQYFQAHNVPFKTLQDGDVLIEQI